MDIRFSKSDAHKLAVNLNQSRGPLSWTQDEIEAVLQEYNYCLQIVDEMKLVLDGSKYLNITPGPSLEFIPIDSQEERDELRLLYSKYLELLHTQEMGEDGGSSTLPATEET